MGTKTKGIQKKKQAQEKVPPTPQEESEKAIAYINDLLSGKETPTNKYAKDLLNQVRDAEQQRTQLRNMIERLNANLQDAQTRLVQLTAVSQQLGSNLYRWKELVEKE